VSAFSNRCTSSSVCALAMAALMAVICSGEGPFLTTGSAACAQETKVQSRYCRKLLHSTHTAHPCMVEKLNFAFLRMLNCDSLFFCIILPYSFLFFLVMIWCNSIRLTELYQQQPLNLNKVRVEQTQLFCHGIPYAACRCVSDFIAAKDVQKSARIYLSSSSCGLTPTLCSRKCSCLCFVNASACFHISLASV
jgi:hypothetical protein